MTNDTRCSPSALPRGKNLTPFHSTMNERHQAISDLNARLSRMLWCGLLANVSRDPASRSISRRKKERPGLTTLQAWLSTPMSDSNSLLEHTFLSPLVQQVTDSLEFRRWKGECTRLGVQLDAEKKRDRSRGALGLLLRKGNAQDEAQLCHLPQALSTLIRRRPPDDHEVVQVVGYLPDPSLADYPLEGVGYQGENLRCRAEAERPSTTILPFQRTPNK